MSPRTGGGQCTLRDQRRVCTHTYTHIHTYTHTRTHTHTHTQGRALNHWRHFFCNLCITLQLAQPNPPAGTAEDMGGGGGGVGGSERERRQPARTPRKNHNRDSRDDENWDQLYWQVSCSWNIWFIHTLTHTHTGTSCTGRLIILIIFVF